VGSRQDDAVVARVAVACGRLTVERPSQPRDERLHALRSARGRGFAPQLIDDLVDRHDLVGVQQEQREQSALLPTAERKRAVAVMHLERSEYAEVHPGPF